MILRHVRAITALTFLTLAVAASAGTGVSQAATTGPPARSASPGTGPQGKLGIQLLQMPVSEANDPRASMYIIDHLPPGTVIYRNFKVTNLGDGPLRVKLYPAAATLGQGGIQFAAGHAQNEMTTWVQISQAAVNLAPHTAATLTATIAVPADAPPGEQYGVIWAEQDGHGSGSVSLASRVGIRLYLSIGGGNPPAANFTIGTPTVSHTSAGNPLIHVPVHNTGGRAVDVLGSLRLTGGPNSLQAGPFPAASTDTLAPGQSHPETFMLSLAIPDGPWQATFTLTSGLITRTETVTLNLGGGPAGAARTAFPVLPVAAGVTAAILLAIAVLLILRARRTPPPGTADAPG